MDVIEVERTNSWSYAVERIRRACFPGDYPSGTAMERFDVRSTHIVARVQGHLAAYARLTPGPDSVFEAWTRGAARIPTGERVVDLSRCAVAAGHRGLGLLRLITVESLLAAEEAGFEQAVGSVIPSEPFAHVFHAAGFEPRGPVVEEVEPSGERFQVQPIACALQGRRVEWERERERIRERLEARGYALRDA